MRVAEDARHMRAILVTRSSELRVAGPGKTADKFPFWSVG